MTEPAVPSLAFALPVLPGRTDAARALFAELESTWRSAYEESQRRIGLTGESWFLQEGPDGALLVVHLEGPDVGRSPAAFVGDARGFETWFVDELAGVTGFRLDPAAGAPGVLLSHYAAPGTGVPA